MTSWLTGPFIVLFFNYILFLMLLQLSQFFPLLPSTKHPHPLRQSTHHCSRPWVMCMSSLTTPFPTVYFTPHGYSVPTYLYYILSHLHLFSHTPSLLATIKRSLYSQFCLWFAQFVFQIQLFFFFFKILFIYFQTEGKGGREGEKHQCVVASHVPPLGIWPTTQGCALTGNPTGDPLVCIPALNPVSHTSQGQIQLLTDMCLLPFYCSQFLSSFA